MAGSERTPDPAVGETSKPREGLSKTEDDTQIALQRLEIEREQLEIDRAKLKLDSRPVNRHLGAYITGIISLFAVFVSILQVINSAAAARRSAAALSAENDREWSLRVASFVSEYRDLILSHDRGRVMLARTAVNAALPRPFALTLATALSEGSTDSTSRNVWSDARNEIISRIQEDLEQRLKKLSHGPGTPAQLTEAERILRRLGCSSVRLTGPDYLTGILPDGLEVAVFASTYGKPGTYGIRFGSPDRGRPYFGSNDTYFEYSP